jgi:uncharacterized membrane protein
MKIIHNYNKPTPAFWRRLGDAMLAASTTAGVYAIATDHETVAVIVLIVGSVGKFLTNFFSTSIDSRV